MTNETFLAEAPCVRRVPRDAPSVRLVCFPYAGMGASIFRSWSSWLPDWVEIVAMQLPGREDRAREEPPCDVAALARSCAFALRPYCTLPLVFYGHCAGALLAYEVAHQMGTRFGVWPARFIAAAQPAPGVAALGEIMHTLADEDFIDRVRRRGGLPDALAGNSGFLSFLLPLLRADFTLWERYEPSIQRALPCPVTVLRGGDDDLVGTDLAESWQLYSTADCEVRVVDGGHYFVNDISEQTKRVVTELVRAR